MSPPEAPPLWRQIPRESLWGRRGLVKSAALWLPLSLVVAANPALDRGSAWLPCLLLFVAAACRTIGSILANDLADRADDTAAGKSRWILRLSPAAGRAAVAAILATGPLALVLGGAPVGAAAAYVASLVLALAYSLRPARLKERGTLGLFAYGAQGALAYGVTPWAWLGDDAALLPLLCLPVFLDKWVNLHFHQVLDREADRSAGVRTYAVAAGLERARRTLMAAACLASASLAGVLAFVAVALPPWGPWVAGAALLIAGAASAYAFLTRRRRGEATRLVAELPCHYLGLTYSLFRVLPVLLFATPALWVPCAIAAGLAALDTWHSLRYRYS
ncbi:MAG: hypothetical protein FJ290_14530 [Planctomycetes bacterium]|nr:hypothetical protein [Planctomycetota bacterium]